MVIIVLRKQQIRTGKMSVYDRISWRIEDNHSMEQLSRVTLYYTPNLVEVGFFFIRLCTRHGYVKSVFVFLVRALASKGNNCSLSREIDYSGCTCLSCVHASSCQIPT